MIENLPLWIPLLFAVTVVATVIWFYLATKSRTFLLIVVGWAIIQSVMGLLGWYNDTTSTPPRIMMFGVFPTLVAIVVTFITHRGRTFIDRIDLKTATYFHTIRIPVEIVLALLYYHEMVSVYMTFEGTNFDLFSGITAPLAGYFAFRNSMPKRKLLLGWNILCLLLLLNVVITAVFALPSPFQKLSFGQPNIAVLYFPFNLLPSLVVPIVFFAHLVAIRQLTRPLKTI